METNEILNRLQSIVGAENVKTKEPMSSHITFRAGGPADFFVTPESSEQIAGVVAFAKDAGIPYFVLGNGSNLLVGDLGIRGIVIQLLDSFSDVSFTEAGGFLVRAQAGAKLSKIGNECVRKGAAGFECLAGIPGSVGGAVRMNAGAYGGEVKDCLVAARVLTQEGEVKELSAEELELSYRHSIVEEKGYIVLEAVFALGKGNPAEIKAKMQDLMGRRRDKQPLEYASAGSTFKRPEGHFAGQLIEEAGLKGFAIGDACVSEKHAGFVVNKGHATAEEIAGVIEAVTKKVQETSGVTLHKEVRFTGEFK